MCMFHINYFDSSADFRSIDSALKWLKCVSHFDELDISNFLFNVYLECDCKLYGSLTLDGLDLYKLLCIYCESNDDVILVGDYYEN